MQTAKASNVPARGVARAVVLEDDTHAVLAVLPASRRLETEPDEPGERQAMERGRHWRASVQTGSSAGR